MTKITKTQIDAVVKEVKTAYDPTDLTRNGHIKFVRFQIDGMTFCYKEGKNLQIEPTGVQKFDVSALSPETLDWITKNKDVITMLHAQLSNPAKKVAKKTAISI